MFSYRAESGSVFPLFVSRKCDVFATKYVGQHIGNAKTILANN